MERAKGNQSSPLRSPHSGVGRRLLAPLSPLSLCLLALLLGGVYAPCCLALDLDLWTATRYRFAGDKDSADHALNTYMDLGLTDIAPFIPEARFTGWVDLEFLDDPYDTTKGRNIPEISQAWMRFQVPDGPLSLRLGRQYLDRIDTLAMDGALLSLSWSKLPLGDKLELMAFGGRPWSFWSDTMGDAVLGGAVALHPWARGRFQADYYALTEDKEWYHATGLKFTQAFVALPSRVSARVRLLESTIRDADLGAWAHLNPINTSLNLQYHLQPLDFDQLPQALSTTFSTFGRIFGATYAHQRVSANAQTFIGDNWILMAGFTGKQLLGNQRQTYPWANQDATVVNGGVTRTNAFIEGLDLSVMGNWVENKYSSFFDMSGEVRQKFNDSLDMALGVTFTGYSADNPAYPQTYNGQPEAYDLSDHIGSRIHYAELKWKITPQHRLVLYANYEVMGQGYGDAVAAQLTYQFHFDWSDSKGK